MHGIQSSTLHAMSAMSGATHAEGGTAASHASLVSRNNDAFGAKPKSADHPGGLAIVGKIMAFLQQLLGRLMHMLQQMFGGVMGGLGG